MRSSSNYFSRVCHLLSDDRFGRSYFRRNTLCGNTTSSSSELDPVRYTSPSHRCSTVRVPPFAFSLKLAVPCAYVMLLIIRGFGFVHTRVMESFMHRRLRLIRWPPSAKTWYRTDLFRSAVFVQSFLDLMLQILPLHAMWCGYHVTVWLTVCKRGTAVDSPVGSALLPIADIVSRVCLFMRHKRQESRARSTVRLWCTLIKLPCSQLVLWFNSVSQINFKPGPIPEYRRIPT